MADRSKIEWTDASWNPIRARNKKTGLVGWYCEHATAGCAGCYAEGFNLRLGTRLPFKPGHLKDVELFLDEDMLTQPLRWKKPRKIFPCSMTDLFAGFVPDEWIDRIFAVMALSPQHTFQVPTKRAKRMREYCACTSRNTINGHIWSLLGTPQGSKIEHGGNWQVNWPLPNVWLGVSAERQQEADERIPELLATPAAVRFISAEPLLGPIDLTALPSWSKMHEGMNLKVNVLSGTWKDGSRRLISTAPRLDWVIVGGESGSNARPMHPDWARSLRDQCRAAGVPFFFKQWGEWSPAEEPASETQEDEELRDAGVMLDGQYMRRVGKGRTGRLLDGVEHNQFPGCGA